LVHFFTYSVSHKKRSLSFTLIERCKMHDIYPISEIIGHKIKFLRERKILSLQEVANAIGIDEIQQARYEKGQSRIPIDKLKQYANYFEINMVTFFIFTEKEKKTIRAYVQKKSGS
ncbi:helix-turn-helix domain-containing protein, partial [Providencia sp. PROV033]